MLKILSKYPFYIFLVLFYQLLYLINKNIAFLDWQNLTRLVYFFLLLSIIIIAIIYLLKNKNITKIGLLIAVLIIPLFFYGIIYNFLELLYYKGLWPFDHVHRYTVILITIVIAIIFKRIYKSESPFKNVTLYLNSFICALVIFSCLILLYNISIKKNCVQTLQVKSSFKKNELPSLYFILLDGYANQRILKQYYNFDNTPFINTLKQNGFTVFDSAQTSYYGTSISLNSTFNMDYLTDSSHYSFADNKVFKTLKEYGYTVYQLESGYSVSDNCKTEDVFINSMMFNEIERAFLSLTIFRLDDLFGLIIYKQLKSQIASLEDLLKINTKQSFVFIHIVAPHPPFVFDEQGNLEKNFISSSHNNWEPRTQYINQLKYINKEMSRFILKLRKKDNTAIVLQSDHGPFISSIKYNEVLDVREHVLNAIYFPNKKNTLKNLNLTNTFRYFLKTYTDSNIQLLPFKKPGLDYIDIWVKNHYYK